MRKIIIFLFLCVFAIQEVVSNAETRTFVSPENIEKKVAEDKKKDKEAQHEAEFPDQQQTLKWANDQVKAAKTLEELKAAQQAINAKLIRGMYLSKGK